MLRTRIAFIFFLPLLFSSLLHGDFDAEALRRVKPYLLQEDHPAKHVLDRIFQKKGVLASEKSLEKAGFIIRAHHSPKHCYIVSHPQLQGYLVKLVLDHYLKGSDYGECSSRATTAKAIGKAIHEYGYEKYFRVPKKWIYLLPEFKNQMLETERKVMVLVVEKMDIVSSNRNMRMWRSPKLVTKKFLRAYHHLLSELGLVDSIYIDNVPFCKDGKVAFVDTQHMSFEDVPYQKMNRHLPKKRLEYWQKLSQQ